MKIKKIGGTAEPQQNEQEELNDSPTDKNSLIKDAQSLFNNPADTYKPSVRPKNQNIYYFSAAGIILLAALIYFAVSNSFPSSDNTDTYSSKENNLTTSGNSASKEDLKRKELELKEKELELREKELSSSGTGSSSSSETQSSSNSVGSRSGSEMEAAAESQIRKWINALGSRDFSTAYYLMDEKRRGSYSKFSSTSAYGGITGTTIYNCYVDRYPGSCSAEVIAEYESIDPYNKSGRFKQRFFVNNCSGSWKITDIKNISINNY